MVRTLNALQRLTRGHTLVQMNVCVPQFLLPKLTKGGFDCEIRKQSTDAVRIFTRGVLPRSWRRRSFSSTSWLKRHVLPQRLRRRGLP